MADPLHQFQVTPLPGLDFGEVTLPVVGTVHLAFTNSHLAMTIGFGIDHFAGTSPVGIIGGVLLGFAVSVWMAWRTAQRLMAEAKQHGEPQSVPFDDDEDQGV